MHPPPPNYGRYGSEQAALRVVGPMEGFSPPAPWCSNPSLRSALPLSIPAAAAGEVRSRDVVYTASLLMRRGRHVVAVGLRDEMSGATAFVRRAVVVGG